MIDQREIDDRLRAWLRDGSEIASTEFVERTLRPIPRMRQRRSWRIALDGWATPLSATVAAATAVTVVALSLIVVAGLPGRGWIGQPAPSAPAGLRPSFVLSLDDLVVRSDPAASVATCLGDEDGSWSVLYAGGEPFVSLDLVVGAGAGTAGREDAVAAEIQTAGEYVRFDPSVLRGGDPPGRSSATVEVTDDGPVTSFVITATTPQRVTGSDGPAVEVGLTLTCAPTTQEVSP